MIADSHLTHAATIFDNIKLLQQETKYICFGNVKTNKLISLSFSQEINV